MDIAPRPTVSWQTYQAVRRGLEGQAPNSLTPEVARELGRLAARLRSDSQIEDALGQAAGLPPATALAFVKGLNDATDATFDLVSRLSGHTEIR